MIWLDGVRLKSNGFVKVGDCSFALVELTVEFSSIEVRLMVFGIQPYNHVIVTQRLLVVFLLDSNVRTNL